MWRNRLYLLMAVGGVIILVLMIIFVSAYLYGRLSPANVGTMMGIGQEIIKVRE